jgi:ribosomal protein L13
MACYRDGGAILGRIATQAASILMGKTAIYTPILIPVTMSL